MRPPSLLAPTFLHIPDEETAANLVAEYARVANAGLYLRSPEEVPALLAPWQVVESRPVEEYAGPDRRDAAGRDAGLDMHGLFATLTG